ncbi:putative ABC transporter permease [Paenibacillus marinisediminis]
MTGSALFFYFMVYACGGWLLEQAYCKWTTGAYKQEGFLLGPFKPMYGIAPMLLIMASDAGVSWWGMLLLSFFIPSLVEYVSGLMLDKMFYKRYWDYSDYRFQMRGYVCLRFSLYWLLLSVGVLYILHPAVAAFYGRIEPAWLRMEPVIIMYMVGDIGSTLLHRRSSRAADLT